MTREELLEAMAVAVDALDGLTQAPSDPVWNEHMQYCETMSLYDDVCLLYQDILSLYKDICASVEYERRANAKDAMSDLTGLAARESIAHSGDDIAIYEYPKVRCECGHEYRGYPVRADKDGAYYCPKCNRTSSTIVMPDFRCYRCNFEFYESEDFKCDGLDAWSCPRCGINCGDPERIIQE